MIPATAKICGINSRRFDTRSSKAKLGSQIGVDLTVSQEKIHSQLIHSVPQGKVVIAESGIHDPEKIGSLLDLGYRAALIGTAFLKGPKKIEDVVQDFDSYLLKLTRPSQS
jgi:indole-3-glycerol phosphate synthase